MSDITTKVSILIGGDATQAKKVIQEVENELKASKQRQQAARQSELSTMENHGKMAGDRMGMALNRAQDRWLNVASNSFRKWGGTIGSIIGDVIDGFDRIDKAKTATERYERAAGRSMIDGTVGHTVSTAVGSAASHLKIPKAKNVNVETGFQVINGKGYRFMLTQPTGWLRSARSAGDMFFNERMGIGEIMRDQRMGSLPTGSTLGIASKILRRGKLGGLGKGFRQPSMMDALGGGFMKPTGILSRIAPFVGGSIGLAVGGGIAAIAGVVAVYEKLAKSYDEVQKKRDEFNKNETTIRSIEEIGSVTEKTTAILKKFGEDGQAAFRKLKEEQAALKEELAKNEGWEGMQLQAKMTTTAVGEFFGDMWRGIKHGVSAMVTGLALDLPFGFEGRVSQQMAEENDALVQKNQRDLAALDKRRAEKAKLAADEAKGLEDSTKERLKLEKEMKELNANDDPAQRLADLKKEVELQKELLENEKKLTVGPKMDKVTLAKQENELLSKQLDLQKELNIQKKRANELEEEAFNRMVDKTNKDIEASQKRKDNDKFDIGGLASAKGVNPRAVGAAKDVQNLEEQAKIANANGRPQDAARLRNQANQIRARLGAAGIIRSSEFNKEEYPVVPPPPRTLMEQKGMTATAYTANSDGIKPIYGPENQKIINAFGPLDNPDKKLKIMPFRLNDPTRQDRNNLIDGQTPKTLEGYFAANGYLPTRLKSSTEA